MGLDFVSRVDLRPRSQDELVGLLRKMRRRFEVICVLCETKEVARQAAKNTEWTSSISHCWIIDVGFLIVPKPNYSGGSAGFEVDVKPLLVLEGPARVRFLTCLRREMAIALEFRFATLVSSGVSEPWLLRKPREMSLLVPFRLNWGHCVRCCFPESSMNCGTETRKIGCWVCGTWNPRY